MLFQMSRGFGREDGMTRLHVNDELLLLVHPDLFNTQHLSEVRRIAGVQDLKLKYLPMKKATEVLPPAQPGTFNCFDLFNNFNKPKNLSLLKRCLHLKLSFVQSLAVVVT